MADASNIDAPKILEAIGQLRTGGLVLVGLIVICALLAWMLWLRSKRSQALLDAQAQRAEARAKEIENEAKEKRADRYASALDSLKTAITELRTNNNKGSQAIQDAVASQTTALSKSIHALESGHAQRQADLTVLMRELLDRQKGVINLEDSFRIIEINFRLEIKPSILATVEASIRNNHYSQEAAFIQERFVARVNKILFMAQEALSFYTLSVRVDFFLPSNHSKHYELTDQLWTSLRSVHETPIEGTDEAALQRRVQRAQLKAENVMNSFLNTRISEVRSNQDDNALRPTSHISMKAVHPA
ncbi:MAG TPA: hypothetical protein PLS53_00340 [Thermoanaerobaculaceae bacterium]|nr:hypothetical protein [Thermoanaerobaculaceae bacterium]HPS76582.1 hypothetical protein [Thermoanaerobaculaceae bacterium]